MGLLNNRGVKYNSLSRNRYLQGLFLFCYFSLSTLAHAKHETLESLLADYRDAFPQIEFKLLYSRNDLADILPLTKSLGHDVSNVDYAHPENTRITLIEAQEYRIETLLGANMPSATLFKSPNAILTDKPFTCLITMNYDLLGNDPMAASRFMYGLSDQQLASLPREQLFDNKVFSLYALDHEVFHCVDTFLNGPLFPITHDPITASYSRYRGEIRAEVFSHIRHYIRHPKNIGFLHKICNAKTINLLAWDVEHYSVPVLRPLHKTLDQLPSTDFKDMTEYTIELADKILPSAEEYTLLLNTIYNTLLQYGLTDEDLPEWFYPIMADEPDLEAVEVMSKDFSSALNTLNLAL